MTGAPRFHAWLDRFFESYYRHRPVNATFIGRHEYDDKLPDYSEVGIEAVVSEMKTLRRELSELPDEELSPAETTDRELARGFLEIQSWEHQSRHFHRGNPAWYTGEAIFGVVSLLLRNFAPLAERLDCVRARLEAVPGLLAQARENVHEAPRPWSERAIDECDGALALFERGLPLLAEVPGVDPAIEAFSDFRAYLDSLPDTDTFACGEDAFALLLREGHFVDDTAEDILSRAEDECRRSESELSAGVADWKSELARLAAYHPTRERYYEAYRDCWAQSRALAEDKLLITWPDYPIDYVSQPQWAREASPHLYFLYYRAPAPFDRLPVVDYLAPPFSESTNDSVIKLNHVVHHGGIGHHIQNWHAYRAPSRIGQIAAVDCASRIAMFCGGTMAEGWACYATDLMDEAGFLTPLESYSQHHAHLRMAARAVVDVRVHRGDMSFEEAERFYIETTNMSNGAARSEVTKNTMFPGAAVIYFVGATLIHELRRELTTKLGSRFDLRAFHDDFLSHGSVPVSLIRNEMLDEIQSESRGGDPRNR